MLYRLSYKTKTTVNDKEEKLLAAFRDPVINEELKKLGMAPIPEESVYIIRDVLVPEDSHRFKTPLEALEFFKVYLKEKNKEKNSP